MSQINANAIFGAFRAMEKDGLYNNADEKSTVEILSALRSQYNCFDEAEEPVYRALSEAIKALNAESTEE